MNDVNSAAARCTNRKITKRLKGLCCAAQDSASAAQGRMAEAAGAGAQK